MLNALTNLVGANKCTGVIQTAFRTTLATLDLLQHSLDKIERKEMKIKYEEDIADIFNGISEAGSSFVEKSFSSLTKDTSMLKEVLEVSKWMYLLII